MFWGSHLTATGLLSWVEKNCTRWHPCHNPYAPLWILMFSVLLVQRKSCLLRRTRMQRRSPPWMVPGTRGNATTQVGIDSCFVMGLACPGYKGVVAAIHYFTQSAFGCLSFFLNITHPQNSAFFKQQLVLWLCFFSQTIMLLINRLAEVLSV